FVLSACVWRCQVLPVGWTFFSRLETWRGVQPSCAWPFGVSLVSCERCWVVKLVSRFISAIALPLQGRAAAQRSQTGSRRTRGKRTAPTAREGLDSALPSRGFYLPS